MMTEMADMLAGEMSDMTMRGMDMSMMQDCMDACAATEQACTMCADAMTGADQMMCRSMCMSMADMSNTMMRMMMRPHGMHMPSMMAMMEAGMTMANACADECMRHAEMDAHCRLTAQVCRNMVMACEAMMSSMRSMEMRD